MIWKFFSNKLYHGTETALLKETSDILDYLKNFYVYVSVYEKKLPCSTKIISPDCRRKKPRKHKKKVKRQDM